MYVIIWEYQVKADHVAEFEDVYSASGLWAELFGKAKGYLGTELLRDSSDPGRYITIDRWASSQDHKSFLLHWKTEYAALDVQCEHLTEKESLLSSGNTVNSRHVTAR